MTITTEIDQTLYKLDSKGKIRVGRVHTLRGTLTVETGLKSGAKVPHVSYPKPKNIGKKNETSSSSQAISEALNWIKKKLKDGYFETENEALTNIVIKPMLAKSFEDENSKIQYPVYCQPKLDGIRAIKNKARLMSRKNREFTTMHHIVKVMLKCPYELDGELYIHGKSFQENVKAINKSSVKNKEVVFHVYDIISDESFESRYSKLKTWVDSLPEDSPIKLVPTTIVESEDALQEMHDDFVSQGYEGLMVRWGEEGYKVNGRSSNLLKFKSFIDRAYLLVDIVPANKNESHGVPKCKVDDLIPLTTKISEWYHKNGTRVEKLNSDGVLCGYAITRCGCKLSHEDRIELLTNKSNYIGKLAEIRFFEFYDSGVPRFPVYHGIRIDK